MSARIAMLLIMGLGIVGCKTSTGTPATTLDTEQTQSTITREHYKIHFAPAVAEDARAMDGFMAQAITNLQVYFRRVDTAAILADIAECDIYVYEEPNDRANEGTATLFTEFVRVDGRDKIKASIHFLALSKHPPGSSTGAGEPKDANYIFKTLIHEYATIWLQLVTSRVGQWDLYEAPSWFVQGYQEYLGLTLAAEHSRTTTLNLYKQMVREQPSRIDTSFGISVRDPYYDGTVLLAFMHEVYGQERLLDLLSTRQGGFRAGIRAVAGSVDSFTERFETWRNNLPR